MIIGAQLYTLREYTKTLDGFAEALKKVADIGYTAVQVSGTCDFEAAWLRDKLQENGLHCVITHTNPTRILQQTQQVIQAHRTFGCRFIGIGMAPGGMEAYDEFVRTFKPVAQNIADAGMQLAYHNHNIEFARTGKGHELFFDRLLQDFTPRELAITFDTYWAQAGGADAAAWLRKLSGRVRNIHLKDMAFVLGDGLKGMRMAPVGEGNMNFDAILSAAEDAGTEYLLVEQDDCYGEDPFTCLEISYRNLRAKGLQ